MKKIFGVLISIVVVVLLAYGLIDYTVRSQKPDFSRTNIEIAEKMISLGNYIVIDVRDKEDYDAEHIVDAVHIPLKDLEVNLTSYEDVYGGKNVIICSTDGKEANGVYEAIIESESSVGVVEIGINDKISLGKEIVFMEDIAVPMTEDVVAEETLAEEIMSEENQVTEVATIEQPLIRYINFGATNVCILESETVATPIELSLVSEQGNGISELPDWFSQNALSLPMIDGTFYNMEPREDVPKLDDTIQIYDTAFYDENYIYHWSPDTLDIYNRETCELLYCISYESDRWYLMGNCAYLRDGVLYIGSLYNGYAMPGTCFLVAYDIEKDEVIWRSEDQTYNTMNFIVKDDVIICGYGFTSEKDYIYQIDINTGKVISKTELKKMPDMFVEKDGQLYVHTYSYDYVFDMN